MKSCAKPEAPIAADGGLKAFPRPERDPYQALDELMVVVEALCPEWPPRPGPAAEHKMLL